MDWDGEAFTRSISLSFHPFSPACLSSGCEVTSSGLCWAGFLQVFSLMGYWCILRLSSCWCVPAQTPVLRNMVRFLKPVAKTSSHYPLPDNLVFLVPSLWPPFFMDLSPCAREPAGTSGSVSSSVTKGPSCARGEVVFDLGKMLSDCSVEDHTSLHT